jgi:hypothetical protein
MHLGASFLDRVKIGTSTIVSYTYNMLYPQMLLDDWNLPVMSYLHVQPELNSYLPHI